MGHIATVRLSGDREAWIDYEWHIEADGSRLAVQIRVDHDTCSGLTLDDQFAVLDAVGGAIRHFG